MVLNINVNCHIYLNKKHLQEKRDHQIFAIWDKRWWNVVDETGKKNKIILRAMKKTKPRQIQWNFRKCQNTNLMNICLKEKVNSVSMISFLFIFIRFIGISIPDEQPTNGWCFCYFHLFTLMKPKCLKPFLCGRGKRERAIFVRHFNQHLIEFTNGILALSFNRIIYDLCVTYTFFFLHSSPASIRFSPFYKCECVKTIELPANEFWFRTNFFFRGNIDDYNVTMPMTMPT